MESSPEATVRAHPKRIEVESQSSLEDAESILAGPEDRPAGAQTGRWLAETLPEASAGPMAARQNLRQPVQNRVSGAQTRFSSLKNRRQRRQNRLYPCENRRERRKKRSPAVYGRLSDPKKRMRGPEKKSSSP